MKGKKASALSEFHNLAVDERLSVIEKSCGLSSEAVRVFQNYETLNGQRLEEIGENPVSNFELPLRVADHFRINGKRYYVPYVVEEASVLAGACYGAKMCGNIEAKVDATKSYAKSQIQLIKVKDLTQAKKAIVNNKEKLLNLANSAHKYSKAFEIEVKASRLTRGNCLTVNLLIDPGDAMGAAVASEMAEAVAPELAELTGSTYNARIISNYSGRLTKARAEIPVRKLKTTAKLGDKRIGWSGEEVCDRILWLYEWAEVDEERAVTYNKGIMNGVDAVALATCQDWRAIEAANALYAHRSGRCRPLSRWYQQDDCLVGEIELLVPCGIVGGEIKKYLKPEKLIKEVLKLQSADELAEIMAAAGLANNFAAKNVSHFRHKPRTQTPQKNQLGNNFPVETTLPHQQRTSEVLFFTQTGQIHKGFKNPSFSILLGQGFEQEKKHSRVNVKTCRRIGMTEDQIISSLEKAQI